MFVGGFVGESFLCRGKKSLDGVIIIINNKKIKFERRKYINFKSS